MRKITCLRSCLLGLVGLLSVALLIWGIGRAWEALQPAPLNPQPYPWQAAVEDGSPWPTFRHDLRNTGRSSLAGDYTGDRPWTFRTNKGIFSTPVIDAAGTVYVGSADHFFYALRPDGSLDWKYQTGEIIDSAGALVRAHTGRPSGPDNPTDIVFISGDGFMYRFHTGPGYAEARERQVWTFEAALRPGISFNRWFEGNVAVGPDGTLYAGNTNFSYYAIQPDGRLKWTYHTASNNWSLAAFGADGSLYWGSNDTFIRAVSSSGTERWRARTLGFIAASAAVGSDGTLYMGSFDSNLYALDPRNGHTRWKFPSGDHLYASAALGQDSQGRTSLIYFGSTDGFFYALSPNGKLAWKYYVGDPIRSSPAVMPAPPSVAGAPSTSEIIFFGAGNGHLYALNSDGTLRWTYDTTPDDPELSDRNDLNGSPALGRTGIYIGGEHGDVVYVPYDYCLQVQDSRCKKPIVGVSRPDQAELSYVTPGGNTQGFPEQLPASTHIILRLSATRYDQPVDAHLCNHPLGCPADALQARLDPPLPFRLEHSADGRYAYLLPQGFWQPGQAYTLTVSGRWYTNLVRVGNLTLVQKEAGRFEDHFHFHILPETTPATLPLSRQPERVAALEWTRLAAPVPPMLPSLNQIGFDYIDWIIAPVVQTEPDARGSGRMVLWAIGARRNAQGVLVADPNSDFSLPLSGSYLGSNFILENRGFHMPITGIDIPFNLFQLRGRLAQDGRVEPGATCFADTEALSIPNFGPYLVIAGLANDLYKKLLVSGTYITRPYPANGPAVQRPAGIELSDLRYTPPGSAQDGSLRAEFRLAAGTSYPTRDHRPGLVLIDTDNLQAVSLDYRIQLKTESDASGNLLAVQLTIPKGTTLPNNLSAYVMLDAFPLAGRSLK